MSFFKRSTKSNLPVEALIIGLGNPGPQYTGTRHNVGFDVIDAIAKKHKIQLKNHKFQSQYGTGNVEGHEVALIKPLTFMNLSGRAVISLLRHYAVRPETCLVIADDLDMAVGRVRMKPEGSSGGHNGHKSIIHSLGTTEYPRIKIGIGKGGVGTDHVLSRFHPDERVDINKAIEKCVLGCELWLTDGIEIAMNRVNTN